MNFENGESIFQKLPRTYLKYDKILEKRLQDEKCLENYGFKVYSQNDEDGIIEEIFNRIGTTNKIFVEFGIEIGLETNAHYLLHKGWSGLWIEGSEEYFNQIKIRFLPVIRTGQLKVENAFIDKDNINDLIARNGFVGEIDLLSVDIDGNDYYVWQNISVIKPRVVVIEYNAKFPPNYAWKQAYNAKHTWDYSDWQGASLKALENLGNKLGYQLVGTCLAGVNAFFVRKDLAKDLFIQPATAENLYNPARYGIFEGFNGHPPKYCLINQLPNLGEQNYNPEYFEPKQNFEKDLENYNETLKSVHEKFDRLGFSNPQNAIYKPEKANSKFFLPYANFDSIQKIILGTDDYFEITQLKHIFYDFKNGLISKIISKQGSVMLDIGANIGNHTLYFANELHAGNIFSFEPVKKTFQNLKINIELNNLQDKVELFNLGLSDKPGRAQIGNYNVNNIGGTDLVEGSGDIEISTLDSFNFQKIDFIKIDVERMELQVLQGAAETIKRTQPFIVMESFPERFQPVEEFMKKLGYKHYEKITEIDYLFYPEKYYDYHDSEVENYDIIICVDDENFENLKLNLDFVEKNLGHEKIILIGEEKFAEQFQSQKIEFLSEEKILQELNFKSVEKFLSERGGNKKLAREYLKQFLQMYYAFHCEKNYYLIWDGATVPLKPIYFLNNLEEMFFKNNYGRYAPYFETMTKLFKGRNLKVVSDEFSFDAEGIIVKTEIMRSLIAEFGGEDFWKIVFTSITEENLKLLAFSASETYGTYLTNKVHGNLKINFLNSFYHGKTVFKRNLSHEELNLLPYDTITFDI